MSIGLLGVAMKPVLVGNFHAVWIGIEAAGMAILGTVFLRTHKRGSFGEPGPDRYMNRRAQAEPLPSHRPFTQLNFERVSI